MTAMYVRNVLTMAVLWIAASASTTYAQSSDAQALVKRGKLLWSTRACAGCHGVGKMVAGPDLAGVSQRRTREWLANFMKDTDRMLSTDSTAMALLKEWKGVRMPKTKMTDQDVEAILAYIQSEEAKLKQ